MWKAKRALELDNLDHTGWVYTSLQVSYNEKLSLDIEKLHSNRLQKKLSRDNDCKI